MDLAYVIIVLMVILFFSLLCLSIEIFFCKELLPLLLCLFIQLFVSVWTRRNLFNSLAYNPIVLLFILLPKVLTFVIGSPFRLTPENF